VYWIVHRNSKRTSTPSDDTRRDSVYHEYAGVVYDDISDEEGWYGVMVKLINKPRWYAQSVVAMLSNSFQYLICCNIEKPSCFEEKLIKLQIFTGGRVQTVTAQSTRSAGVPTQEPLASNTPMKVSGETSEYLVPVSKPQEVQEETASASEAGPHYQELDRTLVEHGNPFLIYFY